MDTPRSFLDDMRAAGVEVHEFRPMNLLEHPRISEIQNRDHRKIVVIEGSWASRAAFTSTGRTRAHRALSRDPNAAWKTAGATRKFASKVPP
jgi:phosphatidylserine/phosphatidylglycerophosphate/cardiolipin synthase-like enzyme